MGDSGLPFIKSKRPPPPVFIRVTKKEISASDAAADCVADAITDCDEAVVIHEKCGVMPVGQGRGNAGVAGIRKGLHKGAALCLRGGRWEADLGGKLRGRETGGWEDIGNVTADLGDNLPEQGGTAATKYLADGNNEKALEDVGKHHGQVGMIEDTAEGGREVVNMLKQILSRVGDPQVPDVD